MKRLFQNNCFLSLDLLSYGNIWVSSAPGSAPGRNRDLLNRLGLPVAMETFRSALRFQKGVAVWTTYKF